jgi:hypothetical protein
MRCLAVALLAQTLSSATALAADYHITGDYGGVIDEYKTKYAAIRDRGDRVIIDGTCVSACTLVLGIVPLNRICVTSRARLGFHMAYHQRPAPDGSRIISYEGTEEVMSYYAEPVKQWLEHHGGLTSSIKKLRNGPELWRIVDPCPEEFF